MLESNGRYGVSIGHKDTDNLIRNNKIVSNAGAGIYFRSETVGMAGHRNTIELNVIKNNASAGIHIRGATNGLVIRDNIVSQPKTLGVVIESQVGHLSLDGNKIDATKEIDDKRSRPEPE
ncbi:MAG: right-handed parallel beta-helix repeat-containing protein [Verrucomicrobiales bacterium]|nr:right-handed parallel beta-helix repeat-containing protein [Verrucomicrobiales bacterium]